MFQIRIVVIIFSRGRIVRIFIRRYIFGRGFLVLVFVPIYDSEFAVIDSSQFIVGFERIEESILHLVIGVGTKLINVRKTCRCSPGSYRTGI